MTLNEKQPDMWLWSENGVHSKIWTELSTGMFIQMAVQITDVRRLLVHIKHVLHFEWQYQHKGREGTLVKNVIPLLFLPYSYQFGSDYFILSAQELQYCIWIVHNQINVTFTASYILQWWVLNTQWVCNILEKDLICCLLLTAFCWIKYEFRRILCSTVTRLVMGIRNMLASVGASLVPSVFMGTTSRSHSVDYCTPRSKHSSFIHTLWLINQCKWEPGILWG